MELFSKFLDDEDAECASVNEITFTHSLDLDKMESLVSTLLNTNCKFQQLKLESDDNGKDKEDKLSAIKMLAGALGSKQCRLKAVEINSVNYSVKYRYGDEGANLFATAIERENCCLQRLVTRAQNIGAEGAKSLAKALQNSNCHLNSLSLSLNYIGDEGAKSLAKAIQSRNCHLNSLNLECNEIGDEGAQSLAEALESENCHLKVLNLKDNELGDKGAKSLAEAIESENCKLKRLDLRYNSVGDEGIAALAKVLAHKPDHFQKLDLRCWEWDCSSNFVDSKEKDSGLCLSYHYGSKGENSLVNALVSKDCHVHALNMSMLERKNRLRLIQALTSGDCQLKKLSYILENAEEVENIAEALQTHDCKLEHLMLFSQCVLGAHANVLADALQSKHCKLQTLCLCCVDMNDEDKFIGRVIGALKQPHCKLRTLTLHNHYRDFAKRELWLKHVENWEEKNWEEKWEEQLLSVLMFNYQCPLEKVQFSLDDARLQNEKLLLILNRNRILRQSELPDQPQVQPTTAKLFICGFSRVGKSTIRENIVRKIPRPNILQQHASTIGMDLHTLRFGDKKLVLCDLAGQKEFHAFHHHFVRGSDKDIFLIVCKAPLHNDNSSLKEFKDELRYWLRFIVSHRSFSSKPKVLIVLNYFMPFSGDKLGDARALVKDQVNPYKDLLDFGKSKIEDNIFGVVALNQNELQSLKKRIGETLGHLLEERPKIPQACIQLIAELKQIAQGALLCAKRKIITYEELLRILYQKKFFERTHIAQDTLSSVLSYLHDMGGLIYLVDIPEIIILDAQWFVREVIGNFITPKLIGRPSEDSIGAFDIEHVKRNLRQICELPDQAEAILKCLNKLGIVFLPNDAQVLVPALLDRKINEYPGFKDSSMDNHLMGRRYECIDKEYTLLPSGLFTKLQVDLHQICGNKSYNVGGGWVAFAIERIHFCIKIGGHTDDWKDRQWLDIMIWSPKDASKETISNKYFEIRKCVLEVCVADSSCPCISLEEHVMKFEFNKPSLQNGQPLCKIEVIDVEPLSKIKDEAKAKGLSYEHTWKDARSNSIIDLLFLQEIYEFNYHLKEVENRLKDIRSEVNILIGQEEPEMKNIIPSMGSLHGVAPTSSELLLLHQISSQVQEVSNKMDKVIGTQEEILQAINGLQTSIAKGAEEILKQIAKSVQLLTTDLPRLPYFTDEKNFIQKYTELFGSNVRFHLMCEAKEGPHHVMNQAGIIVKLPPDWLVKLSPILAPAIMCLTVAIKVIVTTTAGLPSPMIPQLVPGLVNIATDRIPSIVDAIMGQKVSADCILANNLKDGDMREFLRMITKGKGLDMKSDFGLQPVMLGENLSWLCDEHAKHDEILKNYVLHL